VLACLLASECASEGSHVWIESERVRTCVDAKERRGKGGGEELLLSTVSRPACLLLLLESTRVGAVANFLTPLGDAVAGSPLSARDRPVSGWLRPVSVFLRKRRSKNAPRTRDPADAALRESSSSPSFLAPLVVATRRRGSDARSRRLQPSSSLRGEATRVPEPDGGLPFHYTARADRRSLSPPTEKRKGGAGEKGARLVWWGLILFFFPSPPASQPHHRRTPEERRVPLSEGARDTEKGTLQLLFSLSNASEARVGRAESEREPHPTSSLRFG